MTPLAFEPCRMSCEDSQVYLAIDLGRQQTLWSSGMRVFGRHGCARSAARKPYHPCHPASHCEDSSKPQGTVPIVQAVRRNRGRRHLSAGGLPISTNLADGPGLTAIDICQQRCVHAASIRYRSATVTLHSGRPRPSRSNFGVKLVSRKKPSVLLYADYSSCGCGGTSMAKSCFLAQAGG